MGYGSRRTEIKLKNGGTKVLYMNRGKAIKVMCTECMGWETHPNDCTSLSCPLYPWRGKSLEAYHKGHQIDPTIEDNV